MNVYLIGYDLNKPRGADDYEKLHKALKEHSGWYWNHLDSTWIIKSNLSAMQILTALQPYLDNTDELLIVGLTGEWASIGLNESGTKWLKENMNVPAYATYRHF